MIARRDRMLAFAAFSAAVAIAAGAFGAHGVTGQPAEWLKTGGLYQLVHAVAVAAMTGRIVARGPSMLLMAGSLIFAGTLYAMAFGGPRWLGMITPIGGVLMIAGWVWLGLRPFRR
ncbi:DUF423 domain-containing protein [Sphingomonas sanxanigenens]